MDLTAQTKQNKLNSLVKFRLRIVPIRTLDTCWENRFSFIMPSFRVVEVPAGASFEEIAPVMIRAYSNPRSSGFEFAYPIRGTTKEEYDESVEDARRRMSSEHSKNPTNRYIKIVDNDNHGAVVAGAKWQVYESNEVNPHVKGPPWPPTASFIDWWPEGSEGRKFVAAVYEFGLGINRERLRRPHICEYRVYDGE